jgi:hypothetical protein
LLRDCKYPYYRSIASLRFDIVAIAIWDVNLIFPIMRGVAYVMLFIAALACQIVNNFVGFIAMFSDVNVCICDMVWVFLLDSGYISDVLISAC